MHSRSQDAYATSFQINPKQMRTMRTHVSSASHALGFRGHLDQVLDVWDGEKCAHQQHGHDVQSQRGHERRLQSLLRLRKPAAAASSSLLR